ncbi:hypothetical protein FRB95_001206 [Tulasnella sp. JGI-2019a]|nr:hypothetical protein FRB95_001206 [Tulasnella sp. JGI-2019a]
MSTLDTDRLALRAAMDTLGKYQIEYDKLEIDMNNVLGRGGFGVVRRARLGGQVVAVKILRSDESKDMRVAKRLVREMIIWSRLCHPKVLPLIGFYLSQKLDRAIIVCPSLQYGSAQDYVLREKPDEARRLRLAHDTLCGLIYLHGLVPPVVHGDVKAANALVYEDGRAVLADFGLTRAASEVPSGLTTSRGLKGSIRWWSPELFDDEHHSTASDIWAWACLFLEIMKECVPYSWLERDIMIIRAAISGVLPEPKGKLESPLNLWFVIGMCWEAEEKRAAGIMVRERLETLIGTADGISAPQKTISTSVTRSHQESPGNTYASPSYGVSQAPYIPLQPDGYRQSNPSWAVSIPATTSSISHRSKPPDVPSPDSISEIPSTETPYFTALFSVPGTFEYDDHASTYESSVPETFEYDDHASTDESSDDGSYNGKGKGFEPGDMSKGFGEALHQDTKMLRRWAKGKFSSKKRRPQDMNQPDSSWRSSDHLYGTHQGGRAGPPLFPPSLMTTYQTQQPYSISFGIGSAVSATSPGPAPLGLGP